MAIAGVTPYAWETKEGELIYSRTELDEYNKKYSNTLTDREGLYTSEQVEEILLKAAEYWIDGYDYYDEQYRPVDYADEVYDFIRSQEED